VKHSLIILISLLLLSSSVIGDKHIDGKILLVLVSFGKGMEIKKLNLYIKVMFGIVFQMVKE
jgi:hypothetical protein